MAMSLSSEQILALKQCDTKRSFQMENRKNLDPKRGRGSRNTRVRSQLQKAQTHGAKWEDLSGDLRTYMKFMDLPDVEMVPSTKRAAPSGNTRSGSRSSCKTVVHGAGAKRH